MLKRSDYDTSRRERLALIAMAGTGAIALVLLVMFPEFRRGILMALAIAWMSTSVWVTHYPGRYTSPLKEIYAHAMRGELRTSRTGKAISLAAFVLFVATFFL